MKENIGEIIYDSGYLDEYSIKNRNNNHRFVLSGHWHESPYHSGYISYYIDKNEDGVWILEGVSRDNSLDDVTDEDVENGNLNDDQIQAMWNYETLEEAKEAAAAEYSSVIVILKNAPSGLAEVRIAEILYAEVIRNSGKVIMDVDKEGLLK